MKNFNWDDFKKGKIGISTTTEEIAKDFLAKAHNENFKWTSSRSLLGDTYFSEFNDKTAYCYCYGGFGYADIKFCEKEGMQIITWEVSNE